MLRELENSEHQLLETKVHENSAEPMGFAFSSPLWLQDDIFFSCAQISRRKLSSIGGTTREILSFLKFSYQLSHEIQISDISGLRNQTPCHESHSLFKELRFAKADPKPSGTAPFNLLEEKSIETESLKTQMGLFLSCCC